MQDNVNVTDDVIVVTSYTITSVYGQNEMYFNKYIKRHLITMQSL